MTLHKTDIVEFTWRFKGEMNFTDIQDWWKLTDAQNNPALDERFMIMGFTELNGERVSAVSIMKQENADNVLRVNKWGNTVYHTSATEDKEELVELCENMAVKVLEQYSGGRSVVLTN